MRTRLVLLPVLLFAVAAGAQNKPLTVRFGGTWKLNLAKSSLHAPAPQQESVLIEPSLTDTTASKYTITGTDGEGKPINMMWQGKVDDQYGPVMSNGAQTGKVAWRYSGANRLSFRETLNDGTSSTGYVMLSSDGKSYELRQHVSTKQGNYDESAHWDKT
jgi:hypothetical protein